MVKVSIIIPIYNVEKYLRECLESVINQTLKEIEIILINNGSTDSSIDIIKEYKKIDNRIKVIDNKLNVTAGEARNQGLRIASGEYLSFLDSDDWFEVDMLEKVYNICKSNDSDIGIFNAEMFDGESRKVISQIKAPYFFRKNFELDNIKTLDCKSWLFNIINPAAWNKLFKNEYIRKNNIKFQEIPVANDLAFVIQCLFFSESFSYLDRTFVHYRYNRKNSLSSYREKNAMFCYKAFKFAKSKLEQNDKFLFFYDSFFKLLLENLYTSLKTTTKEDYEEVKKILVSDSEVFEVKYGERRICFNKSKEFIYNNICNLNYNNFIKDNFSKSFYEYNYSKIMKLIKDKNSENIALWGAGRNGKAFLEIFGEKLNVKFVIDKDTEKQGSYIGNLKVISFNEAKKDIDMIIVTNDMFYEEILEQVNDYNKEICIINLDSYLRFGIL